MNMFDDVVE